MRGKVLKLRTEELREEGEERLSVLIGKLLSDNRNDEVSLVLKDHKKRKELYKEYGILTDDEE